MLKRSLKSFFGKGVVVENIYHEMGPQQDHHYFDWHTILELDKDEHLNFNCRKVEFLPKSHREDPRSNILQLCDVFAGIYKDLHCGILETKNSKNRIDILKSKPVQDFLVKRTIRNPQNKNSSYGHHKRFQLSFFPKIKSEKNSFTRSTDNYYNVATLDLAFEHNPYLFSYS